MPCHTNTGSKTATRADFFGKRKPTMTTNSALAETVFQNVLVKPSLTFIQNLWYKFIPKFSLKHQIAWRSKLKLCHPPTHPPPNTHNLTLKNWFFSPRPLYSLGSGYHQHSIVSHFPSSRKITMLFFFVSELPPFTLIWGFSKQEGKKIILVLMTMFYIISSPKGTGLHWWPKNLNRQELYFKVSVYMHALHQKKHYCKTDNPV